MITTSQQATIVKWPKNGSNWQSPVLAPSCTIRKVSRQVISFVSFDISKYSTYPSFEIFFLLSFSTAFFMCFAHVSKFYILQISTTTKTCGSSDLRKVIPAQETARKNYFQAKNLQPATSENFSQAGLKTNLTGKENRPFSNTASRATCSCTAIGKYR